MSIKNFNTLISEGSIRVPTITEPTATEKILNTQDDIINHNFQFLKQLLDDSQKNLSFLDFLKITDYITTSNIDSIDSIFFNMSYGEAVGIEVDSVTFDGHTFTRGDYLFKKNNGTSYRIQGPSSVGYLPVFNGFNNIKFGVMTDITIASAYDLLKIEYDDDYTPTYTLYNGDTEISSDITYNGQNFIYQNNPLQFLKTYEYVLPTSIEAPYYNISFKFDSSSTSYTFNGVRDEDGNDVRPIIKTYLEDQDGYLIEVHNIINIEQTGTGSSSWSFTCSVKPDFSSSLFKNYNLWLEVK